MNPLLKLPLMCALAACLTAPVCAQTGFPFQNESLRYSINWPSGLSLGDATFAARKSGGGWNFEASLMAGIPGFTISDRYQSSATAELCSTSLDRTTLHGSKKTQEKTTFDQGKSRAHRVTVFPKDGGESDFDIPTCGRDALTFIYFMRREMGQGRVAPATKVFLGSGYSVRLEYTGAMTIPVGDQRVVTDHVVAYLKGPKADFNIEIFFDRDAARTPLVVRIPLSMGTFAMELVR